MKLTEEDYLAHYGILRRSGRYPWGSGGNVADRDRKNKAFLDDVAQLRKEGMTDGQIAEAFGMSIKQLRAVKSIARNEHRQQQINMAERLRDKGMSPGAIAERMGLPGESSVRALLAPGARDRADRLEATSDMLKRQVEEKGAVDIGTDVYRDISLSDNRAAEIGISSTTFDTAVARLEAQGYVIHNVKVPTGPNQFTTTKVLARPDVPWVSLKNDPQQIRSLSESSDDDGASWNADWKTPISINPDRVGIRYAEDGGTQADGVIFVRPGKDDISLGQNNYAQVRVAVGKDRYLKGMAVYKDDLPEGTDLLFNTNKTKDIPKMDVLKKQSDDTDLPFGTVIKRQIKDDNDNVTSAMNIVNEPGDWDKWSRSLPSQMLSKQSPTLAKQQLDISYDRRLRELDEISSLTNPAVKRTLLKSFSEDADSAAVHLKAAALNQRTGYKVLIPIKSIKENEVYAPSLRDGEKVALVRFPHGGTFEIPQVTVNNRNREAGKIIGKDVTDAIGIHHKVAERLSGADFDGDTVLAIPNDRGTIKSTPALKKLEGFEPHTAYKKYDGMRTVDGGKWDAKNKRVDYGGKKPNPGQMQQEMGAISNLITDMTIRGANSDELSRAVRHSMVIIDSEKHVLDYKSSERDNGIRALKETYQGIHPRTKQPRGASTLISRAGAETRINARKARPAKEGGPIDRSTGKKMWVEKGDTYVDRRTGKVKRSQEKHKRLAVTDDAYALIDAPGTRIEKVYADYSNSVKDLGNKARKEMVNTKSIPYSPSAKKTYSKEVASLESKLNVARKNAPRERQARAIAASIVNQKKRANPELTQSDLKKINTRALAEGRARTGAKKTRVRLETREWQAIQAGAISNDKLEKILNESDLDQVRELATPRRKTLMGGGNAARAKAMLARGYTQAEVADKFGVSLTTLKDSL